MFTKRLTTTVLAASLAVSMPASRAAADAGDAIAGGIIGGLIGGAIVDSQNKKKRSYTASSATRAHNREIQTSLNYFGFNAGTPDGVLGRNSRAAISRYQAFMGYPSTGQLTQYEKDFLLNSYHRAVAGGPATTQLVAQNPQGVQGLLKVYQQEAAGVTVTPQTTEPATGGGIQAMTPQNGGQQGGTGALPSFVGQSGSVSLASHCNQVSLVTSSNGGFTTEASMTDPRFALNEQFCLARTYAIARGEEMIGQIQGFTPQQIRQQCAAFGPAMKDHVSALSIKSKDEVLRDVGQFVLNSGMSPEQLTGTARICLSVGYSTDDMQVALGSALLLVALGEQPYAELMGHHLTQGFGTSRRPDLGLVWYQAGIEAIQNGAVPVFAPGQPERNGLIMKAAFTVNGRSGVTTPPSASSPRPAALPSFSVEN